MYKASCIIPAFVETGYQFKRAVDSVLNQTFKDFELIIIIDNPNNYEIINLAQKYSQEDKRVRYYLNQRNEGIVYSRNFALSIATGEYIIQQDSDDYSYPDRFIKQIEFMDSYPGIDVLSCYVNMKLESNSDLYTIIKPSRDIAKSIKRICPIVGGFTIIRKSSIVKYGYFEKGFLRAEDYFMYIKWFLQGANMDIFPEVLGDYMIQENYPKKSGKSIIQSIHLKWKFRKELKFQAGDYFYFLYDLAVLFLIKLLPSSLFFKLFIFRNTK